jgi:hypothetical protein
MTTMSSGWRENQQAKDWAGHAVAAVLKLDASNIAHRAKISGLLRTWTKKGMLVVVEVGRQARKAIVR